MCYNIDAPKVQALRGALLASRARLTGPAGAAGSPAEESLPAAETRQAGASQGGSQAAALRARRGSVSATVEARVSAHKRVRTSWNETRRRHARSEARRRHCKASPTRQLARKSAQRSVHALPGGGIKGGGGMPIGGRMPGGMPGPPICGGAEICATQRPVVRCRESLRSAAARALEQPLRNASGRRDCGFRHGCSTAAGGLCAPAGA